MGTKVASSPFLEDWWSRRRRSSRTFTKRRSLAVVPEAAAAAFSPELPLPATAAGMKMWRGRGGGGRRGNAGTPRRGVLASGGSSRGIVVSHSFRFTFTADKMKRKLIFFLIPPRRPLAICLGRAGLGCLLPIFRLRAWAVLGKQSSQVQPQTCQTTIKKQTNLSDYIFSP